MYLICKYIKPLKNVNSVRGFLERNKVELPEDLVAFLEKNNGGRPIVNEFSTNKQGGYVFNNLFSYNAEDKNYIELFYPDLFTETSFYPIGMTSSGNFICYDFREKEYVMVNHENLEKETIKNFK